MHFVVSLLLHLALLFGLVFTWVGYPTPHKKPPSMYVPSYAYEPQPSQYAPAMQEQKQVPPPDKNGLEKPVPNAVQIRRASQVQTRTSTKVAEAINLVGDKKTVPQPLIILLGKALAAHLVYPKIAIDFRVHGKAYIGFVLHPDGTLTNVQLVQSSQAGVLDEEAVAAVKAMSPVKNVNTYVDKPRPLVVGIIFD